MREGVVTGNVGGSNTGTLLSVHSQIKDRL